jgi:glutamyl-tRNA reductase
LDHVARVQWTDRSEINLFLKKVRETFSVEEVFFLQTCNRREFYFYAPDLPVEGFKSRFLALLAQDTGHVLEENDFYEYHDQDAVTHLFRVASSLDSMVIGETEIMKQIKDQSRCCLKHKHMGRRLKALINSAIWTAKQVRNRTEITKNVVSMASLTSRKAKTYLKGRAQKRIVFVGAGHFITSILPTFSKTEDFDLYFVNRTRPDELAVCYGGKAIALDDFLADPIPFEVMVTATGSADALFQPEWIRALNREVLLMDAALPADVAPEVSELAGVTYLDLSRMEATLARNRAAREAEIPKTEPIFEEGRQNLKARLLECDLSAYNQQISHHYRDTGEKALSHLLKDEFSGMTDEQVEVLRGWTRALVGKLTNIPILGLKGVAKGIGLPAIDAFTQNVADNSPLFRAEK